MSSSSNPSQVEDHYRLYLDEREALIEAKRAVTTSFDRAVLTLSGGALALSMVFVKQIAPDPTEASLPFLMSAWGVFAAAIVTMLSSLLTSQHAVQHGIDVLDREQEIGRDNEQHDTNWWAIVTKILNWASIILFVTGVGLFAAFGNLNLPVNNTGG